MTERADNKLLQILQNDEIGKFSSQYTSSGKQRAEALYLLMTAPVDEIDGFLEVLNKVAPTLLLSDGKESRLQEQDLGETDEERLSNIQPLQKEAARQYMKQLIHSLPEERLFSSADSRLLLLHMEAYVNAFTQRSLFEKAKELLSLPGKPQDVDPQEYEALVTYGKTYYQENDLIKEITSKITIEASKLDNTQQAKITDFMENLAKVKNRTERIRYRAALFALYDLVRNPTDEGTQKTFERQTQDLPHLLPSKLRTGLLALGIGLFVAFALAIAITLPVLGIVAGGAVIGLVLGSSFAASLAMTAGIHLNLAKNPSKPIVQNSAKALLETLNPQNNAPITTSTEAVVSRLGGASKPADAPDNNTTPSQPQSWSTATVDIDLTEDANSSDNSTDDNSHKPSGSQP